MLRALSQGRVLLIGMVAVLAGLAVGLALVTFSAGRTSDDAGPAASMAQVSLSEAPDTSLVDGDAPSEPTNAPTSGPASTRTEDGTSESGRRACENAVARADEAVDAARTSLDNWQVHYGAQIAFDEGRIDATEAKRRWAESKEPAERNIAAFDAARNALVAADVCDGDVVGGDGDAATTRIRRCAARLEAVSDVMSASEPAFDDWLGHLEMMATRDEYTVPRYLAIWRRTVVDAPGPMAAFDRAVEAYRDVRGCGPQLSTGAVMPTAAAASRHVAYQPLRTAVLCVLGRATGSPAVDPA